MKVRLVIGAWLPARGYGGPIAKIERLAPDLKRHGIELTVVCSDLSAPGQANLPCGPDLELDPPVWRLKSRLALRWSVWPIWPQDLPRADVIHVLGAWNPLIYSALHAAKQAGIPAIWEPAGMLPSAGRHRMLKRALTPLHQGLADAVAALVWTSTRERQESPISTDVARMHVRPNPAPELPPNLAERSDARRELGLPEIAPLWGYLGRIAPRKGIEKLLAAWQQSQGTGTLVFAGPVESKRLAAKIDTGGDNVKRLPGLNSLQRWHYLRAIDALALVPDFGENFGNVVVEAALIGTPVLASQAVGALEYFQDPGIVTVDDAALAARFQTGDLPPAPQGLPQTLQPSTVAAQQTAIYRQALESARR